MLNKIIFANIKHQKFRYTMVFMIMFIMTLCIFSSSMLISSMSNGISTAKNRLGADIIIIPEGNEEVTESSLFNGEPCTLKMDSDWFNKIQIMPYVTDITSRLYLASLSGQSCCDGKVQLIATDISSDFLLKSWINKDIANLDYDEIIVGDNFNVKSGDVVKYYNREFTVKYVLEKTNTGYDKSAFISYDAADAIMSDPQYDEYYPGDESAYNTTSMIFLNSSNPDATNDAIKSTYYYDEIETYSASSKLSDYTVSVNNAKMFSYSLNVLIVIISALALLTINTLATAGRKNEVGGMLNVGFSKMYISKIFIFENLSVSIMASLSAVAIYEIIFNLFNTLINESFVCPMVGSSVGDILIMLASILTLNTVIIVMSAGLSFIHIYKKSPSELIKEAS